jgi:CHAT domain-containing protein
MVKIESRRDAATRRLEKEFPDYAALASPKPLKAQDVQRLLGSDEVLLFWLPGDKESYVFAATQQSFAWKTIPVGAKDLSDGVANFRQGLNLQEVQASIRSGKPVLFDLGLASKLYETLLGPVETLIKDKRHLLVAPTGALTSLPFQLLVAERPATPRPSLKEIAVYRDAAWLIKRHAVSVLPSVASLKALRAFNRKDQSGKPLVGFGDPIFDPAERASPASQQPGSVKQTPSKGRPKVTRAYSEFWQGSGLDRAALSQALPPLPETADELKAVAVKVGAPTADIHLGQDASETVVKRAPLADYRVVYFATHGLVAGEVKGLGEPSLALTLPSQPTDLDDGLLTASEVAQLKLNAEWVVLSACNTAAGEKPGAEALSGLARAFFYAGARALLVSHWSVDSEAATRITTSTFDIIASDAKIGRAEALRRAMLAYISDASNPLNGYPGLWGAFSLIGEGAAR